jgi:phage terminase small subunit
MSTTTLNPKQRSFLTALLACGEVKAASEAAGIARDSAYRYLKDPVFQEALRAAETETIKEVSRGLTRIAKKALRVIDAALDDPEASVGEKLRAADMVLNRLIQIRELSDLEERLISLEARIEADERQGGFRQ